MPSDTSTAAQPIWVEPTDNPDLVNSIVREHRLHPVMAQILVTRGFTDLDDVNKFLYAKLPELLDPLSMPGMDVAVNRIIDAIEKQETILIYGDNDVDGMTATTLLAEFLRHIGGKTLFFITQPSSSRQNLIVEALDYAQENDCKLLITVDCGITAATEIRQLVDKGIDVIITDHHEPTDKVPRCVATLNPKLVNSTYANRDITGVGVAFKLAHGITNRMVSQKKLSSSKVDLKRYLDLVAMGTISDMATLVGENRVFVTYGLKQLRRGRRVGLFNLVAVCGIEPSEITTTTVASKIAPRLNSLGRIADPTKGVELLLARDAVTSERLAKELDLNNIERQKIERTMSAEVERQLAEDPSLVADRAIILSSEAWHPGVIAILSTRISKQYNRPTIMFAIENGVCKGSIRSIPEFPVLSVLKSQEDILMNFGGHDFAAGVTLKQEHFPQFIKAFKEAANGILTEHDVVNKLKLDAHVDFSQLTFDFMEGMRLLEPFGTGNPPPCLYTTARQAWPPKVVGKTHLKLYLEQGDRMLEGIAFNMADRAAALRKKDVDLQVAFTPQINNFHNKASIQLVVRDVRFV